MNDSTILGRTCEVVWVNPIGFTHREPLAGVDPSLSGKLLAMPRGDGDGPSQQGGVDELTPPPTKVVVRSPVHGRIVFDNLEPDTTLGWLKAVLRDRLVLPPIREVHLSTWGNELEHEWRTLQQCKIKTNGLIDMRTSLVEPDFDRPLERVRVASTALETRTLAVGKQSTVLELKEKIRMHLAGGEHEWYDKEGARTSVMGVTLLATANVKGEEKAETKDIRLGEELVSTVPHLGEMGKGKPVSVIRARRGGPPFNVLDSNVVALQLPAEQQKLSFRGVEMTNDAATLFALGCRNDDVVELEFVSPVCPPVLTLLRAPDKPKEKKGKGGKGGKGKKKK